jgi:hypothetical protein
LEWSWGHLFKILNFQSFAPINTVSQNTAFLQVKLKFSRGICPWAPETILQAFYAPESSQRISKASGLPVLPKTSQDFGLP